MRALPFWILALSSTILTSACSPEFDAEEKNNKAAITEGSDELMLRLATASESAGDLAAAERMYLKISKNGKPQSIIDLASFYTRHNQPDRAVDILDDAYKNTPSDINLMRILANSLISAGQPEKALSMLDESIAGDGAKNAYVHNSRGVALDTLGKYKLAQQSYRKAVELNPADEVDFKTNLSMSHILAGEYQRAIDLLEPLFKAKNTTPQARQNLALAYGLLGDMDTAMNIGSKDVSIKEMRENIRFYQHVSGRKNAAIARKASVPDMPPVAAKPFTAEETDELPPPPPAPVRNLTQSPVTKEVVTEDNGVKPQQNVKVYTPSPDPLPSTSIAPLAPEAVKHKMITAPSSTALETKTNNIVVKASEEETTQEAIPQAKKIAPAPLMGKEAIPTPVLKPDNW